VRGFIRVCIANTCTIDGFKLMERNGIRWLAVPTLSYKGPDGLPGFADLVEFPSVQAKRAFDAAVLDGVAAIERATTESGLCS
jgi:hypothetical protein